ncbi:MAG: hypothetical protein KF912_02695 [Phycisphaeraceae bacterium]|nr:hypothetical protein [Phycisphaeraceae bacterium]MBX3366208.1 hypothetical protein [Phycisphaeraceae bacterium]
MTKSTPTDHVRIGAISAAIWANPTEKGIRYSVTIERLYRDPESGNWKSTSSFNRDDMLVVAKVSDLVHTRIHELQSKDRTQDRDAPDADPVETQPKPPSLRGGGATASTSSSRTTAARAKASAEPVR